MVKFSHEDPGTDEAQWTRAGVDRLPRVPVSLLPQKGERIMILSAHPDDETLGAAGLIHRAIWAGISVHVIVCSEGEASHTSSPTHSPRHLAAIRRRELGSALSHLELSHPDAGALTWEVLGLPDGLLADHIESVTCAMTRAMDRSTRLLASTYRHDGHVDHEALGAAAAQFAAEQGLGLLEFPLWYWHWSSPDSHGPWTHWLALRLSEQSRLAKDRAMAAHRSQITALSPAAGDEALLSPRFLQHFQRKSEIFRYTAPGNRDSATAKESFNQLYRERPDPWDYLGSAYEERKRAVTLASLPRSRYTKVVELGCSIGMLTSGLAERSDSLLGIDASQVALEDAGRRLAGMSNVSLQEATLPEQWPQQLDRASQDLIVISEIGYFLASDELEMLLQHSVTALRPGGHLLLCHWMHAVVGWPLNGKNVHDAARKLGWKILVEHREQDFLLEIYEAPDTGDE
jgi:LmbE family N-acetylglucosaminyl deacetylase/SAM-dependent methyltransferase